MSIGELVGESALVGKAQAPSEIGNAQERRFQVEEVLDNLDEEALAKLERRIREQPEEANVADPEALLDLIRRAMGRLGAREGWEPTRFSAKQQERDATPPLIDEAGEADTGAGAG